MINIFNKDFKEFISALNKYGVQYILVGGYAVILHGYHRTTGDLDIWVKPDITNFINLKRSFSLFGLPTDVISQKDFLQNKDKDVFTFGRPPVSIDIMTHVKGLEFDETYKKSSLVEADGMTIRLINLNSLIRTKKSSGRHKDLSDISHLQEE